MEPKRARLLGCGKSLLKLIAFAGVVALAGLAYQWNERRKIHALGAVADEEVAPYIDALTKALLPRHEQPEDYKAPLFPGAPAAIASVARPAKLVGLIVSCPQRQFCCAPGHYQYYLDDVAHLGEPEGWKLSDGRWAPDSRCKGDPDFHPTYINEIVQLTELVDEPTPLGLRVSPSFRHRLTASDVFYVSAFRIGREAVALDPKIKNLKGIPNRRGARALHFWILWRR